MSRIHILGASGSGTTTLGAAVAEHLGVPHVDTDTVFWRPTDPPFMQRRPVPERLALLRERLPRVGGWVLSGCALGWAEPIEPLYELIVYLTLDPVVRLARLRQREHARYGRRIEAGGDMAHAHAGFLAWAAAYDTAGLEQRSRAAHAMWLAEQTAPVIHLDGAMPTPQLVSRVVRALAR